MCYTWAPANSLLSYHRKLEVNGVCVVEGLWSPRRPHTPGMLRQEVPHQGKMCTRKVKKNRAKTFINLKFETWCCIKNIHSEWKEKVCVWIWIQSCIGKKYTLSVKWSIRVWWVRDMLLHREEKHTRWKAEMCINLKSEIWSQEQGIRICVVFCREAVKWGKKTDTCST